MNILETSEDKLLDSTVGTFQLLAMIAQSVNNGVNFTITAALVATSDVL